MLKNVALVALLTAPAALAFEPKDVKGVWHCVPQEGEYYLAGQTASADIKWLSVDDTFSSRVVVFDAPSNKRTRYFTGRTYYTKGTKTEEHSMRGIFSTALTAEFYLDPNKSNAECCLASGGKTCTSGSYLKDFSTDPIGNGAYQLTTHYGSCKEEAAGPWTVAMEDIDHFMLTVDTKDQQIGFFPNPSTTTNGTVASHNYNHVFVVEKCMRGLPEKNEMCDNLKHSNIDVTREMNDACQGTLTCQDIDSNDSSKGKHCATPPTPAPVTYVPQPYYQPQYYQPQYYQPQQTYYQPQQQSYYQPQFWG
jgi:hypothetical protein